MDECMDAPAPDGSAWPSVLRGDKVQLTRTSPIAVVEGFVNDFSRTSRWLSVSGVDHTFYAKSWRLSIIERAWHPPTEQGMYLSAACRRQFLAGSRVPLYRRNDSGEWYLAPGLSSGGWTIVRAAELPRDLVRLTTAD